MASRKKKKASLPRGLNKNTRKMLQQVEKSERKDAKTSTRRKRRK